MRSYTVYLPIALLSLLLVPHTDAQQPLSIYGYFSTRYEKSFAVPEWNGTEIEYNSTPGEFSYPFLNIMMQHQFGEQFRVFLNLNGSQARAIDVRNVWGEYAPSEYLQIRVGKIYRKFGLYNWILDAVPSYYGIEPPELFDTDHLMISRTTTLMLLGSAPLGPGRLNYSVSTDNGEGSEIFEGTFPLGFDVNYVIGSGDLTVGISGYTSGGRTNSDIAFGAGSPKSGVLPWMELDSFTVIDAYVEANIGRLMLQFEYAQADHKALRNRDAVATLLQEADLNEQQRQRFIKPAGAGDTAATINTVGDYVAKTWYVRAGYSFETSIGEVAPYVQWDWYSNPETIAARRFGGDDEAGVADDGVFSKATLGLVLRPVPEVAVKFDGSSHLYTFRGEDVSYLEGRLDVSYLFGL